MKSPKSDIAIFIVLAVAFASAARSSLLDEVRDVDAAADASVASICTREELAAKCSAWRTWWLDVLGGMPEHTPLNARITGSVECDGFRMENIIFESQPGVFVTAHMALPALVKPPYPVVLMPLGHSNAGILNPRYAAHLAMAARSGFAAFAWDPISQGERRQAVDPKYDYVDTCSTEHCRLGARAWLVGWNFARFRIWDAVRAIDYVESRPDLDTSKLGIMGTSGGGTMSAYMQAFDPRIKVSFPNCYVSSLREVVCERGCHDAEHAAERLQPHSDSCDGPAARGARDRQQVEGLFPPCRNGIHVRSVHEHGRSPRLRQSVLAFQLRRAARAPAINTCRASRLDAPLHSRRRCAKATRRLSCT